MSHCAIRLTNEFWSNLPSFGASCASLNLGLLSKIRAIQPLTSGACRKSPLFHWWGANVSHCAIRLINEFWSKLHSFRASSVSLNLGLLAKISVIQPLISGACRTSPRFNDEVPMCHIMPLDYLTSSGPNKLHSFSTSCVPLSFCLLFFNKWSLYNKPFILMSSGPDFTPLELVVSPWIFFPE